MLFYDDLSPHTLTESTGIAYSILPEWYYTLVEALDTGDGDLQDRQISAVVHGFLQVWNRFEVTLSRELAQVQNGVDGSLGNQGTHGNANYELFYRASSCLSPKDALTMGEFSNALSVPLGTATRIADWLVDKGYVQRLPDVEDRRVVRVALTGKGRELHGTIDLYIRKRLEQILSCLTSKERSDLLELVGKVVTGLKGMVY